ncbi:Alpha-N-acetylgalactosaminidase [Schistosoma japonicum]|nr:Alpha-N-acetylgalactosaminidase [Schistosoma japonicum]
MLIHSCVLCLDNGLARTPPMGWMAWLQSRCFVDCHEYPNYCISEKLIQRLADKIVSRGWRELGYRYVITDDCWSEMKRDPKTHKIVADHERFPNGMTNVGQYLHSKNLLFGIYLDYGTLTCEGYPGSMNYLELDARSIAEWKVDYVKMDGCNSLPNIQPEGYENFSRLLNTTGRPMVLSCFYPAYISWLENPNLIDWNRLKRNCNSWRITYDVYYTFDNIFNIINTYIAGNDILPKLAGPGHWNDPDMLLLGNFGLTDDQKRSQFGLWCMFAAPLLIRADIDELDAFSESLLRNEHLLAIDQDKGGHQAEFIKTQNNVQLWVRQLDDYPMGWAIACFYTIDKGESIHFNISLNEFKSSTYSISGNYFELLDVFTGYTIKVVELTELFQLVINPSGIMIYRVKSIHQYHTLQPKPSDYDDDDDHNHYCIVGQFMDQILSDLLLFTLYYFIVNYDN